MGYIRFQRTFCSGFDKYGTVPGLGGYPAGCGKPAERCGPNYGAMKTKDRLRRDHGGYQEAVPADRVP